MGAAFFRTPELALDPTEAHMMIDAIERVDRHYGVVMGAGGKWADWANLCVVLGGVYGTRIVAIRARLAAQRDSRPPTPQAMRPASTAPQPAPGASNISERRSSFSGDLPPDRAKMNGAAPYDPNFKPQAGTLDELAAADSLVGDPRVKIYEPT